jgi:hypothetical protein
MDEIGSSVDLDDAGRLAGRKQFQRKELRHDGERLEEGGVRAGRELRLCLNLSAYSTRLDRRVATPARVASA